MTQIVECVPNISEGRNSEIIEAVADAIRSVDGVKLLDVDPGEDTNRTVITFIGTPEPVEEAAFQCVREAAEHIDMSQHHGAHARQGATDVCPFVPVSGVTMEDCVRLARKVGQRIANDLGIPVYLYEEAATRSDRKSLANVRRGQYESLPVKLKDPEWGPDFGPTEFNERVKRAGATQVGAREFLIAYNVNLNTRYRKLAHDIALSIRETGRSMRDAQGKIVRDEDGKAVKAPGLLNACKAVGWYIDEYKMAQVSINLVNYHITPPHLAFETIREEARKRGLRVTGSELVGLIPKEAMLMAGRYYLRLQGKSTGVPEAELIRTAVHSLGLNEVAPFDAQKKIIEYQFGGDPNSLVAREVRDFVDEVSVDSPAPGGGSVAALSGALASALASMVANLTHGKSGYEETWEEMEEVAVKAQTLKDKLIAAVDRDSEAFNRVMATFGLPKGTEEQKVARHQAIQDATKGAVAVPMEVARDCVEALKLAKIVGERGNANSVSDAGVAIISARAGVEGAALNVKINLNSLEDKEFGESIAKRVESLLSEAGTLAEDALATVETRLRDLG